MSDDKNRKTVVDLVETKERLYPVGRLDYDTSGCLVYAKDIITHACLNKMIEDGTFKRYYLAIVENRLAKKEGIIDLAIGKDRHINGKMIVSKTGKKAITHYKVIKENSLRFDEKIRFGEDAFFWRNVLLNCQSVRLIDKCGYIYYFDDDFFGKGKGVFDKYSLKFEEVDYIASVLVDINRRLDTRFGSCSHKEEGKLYFLQAIKFEDIEKYGLNEYYKLCKKFYPNLSLDEFYSDSLLSPIVKCVVNIKRLYEIRSLNNIENIFNSSEIFKELPWRVRFQHKDFYLWYFLIKCRMWWVLDKMLKFYYKIKK